LKFEIWNLELVWDLEFGIWNFPLRVSSGSRSGLEFEIWNLEFVWDLEFGI